MTEHVKLFTSRAEVVVDVHDGETLAEAAYRLLVSQLGDHPKLQLLQREFDPVLQEAFDAKQAQRDAATAVTDRGERMSRLAESFPTLVGQPGVRPWKPSVFIAQLAESWPGSGARAAIKFIAHVWSAQSHPFDLNDFAAWDGRHRQAFARWAASPWWA